MFRRPGLTPRRIRGLRLAFDRAYTKAVPPDDAAAVEAAMQVRATLGATVSNSLT
jgi:hypothetical protein